MEELEPCGFSPTSTSQAPYLISFLRAESGEFRKLSRGFFFWTSLIEPCQEKIISQKGSGLFSGEQKRDGGGGAARASVKGKETLFFLGAKSSPKNASSVCLAQCRGSKLMKQP